MRKPRYPFYIVFSIGFLALATDVFAKKEAPVPVRQGPPPAVRPFHENDCTWRREFGGFRRTARALRTLAAGGRLSPVERSAFEKDGVTLRPEVLASARLAVSTDAADAGEAADMANAYAELLDAVPTPPAG